MLNLIDVASITLCALVYLMLVMGTKRLATAFRRKIIIAYTTLHLVCWGVMHSIALDSFYYPHRCFSPVPFVLIAKYDESCWGNGDSFLHIYTCQSLQEIMSESIEKEYVEKCLMSIRNFLCGKKINPKEYLFFSDEFAPLGGRTGFIKLPHGWSHTQLDNLIGEEDSFPRGKLSTPEGVLVNYEFGYDVYSPDGPPEDHMHNLLISPEIMWAKTNVVDKVKQYVYFTTNRTLVVWHIRSRRDVARFSAIIGQNNTEDVGPLVSVLNTFRFAK